MPSAYIGFADMVLQGPDEVADGIGMLFDIIPIIINQMSASLGSQQHPLWMQGVQVVEFVRIVIISGNLQVLVQRKRGRLVGFQHPFRVGVGRAAGNVGNGLRIEPDIMVCIFLFIFSSLGHVFVLVHFRIRGVGQKVAGHFHAWAKRQRARGVQ